MTKYPRARFTVRGIEALGADNEEAEITGRLISPKTPSYGVLYEVRYSVGGQPQGDFIHESTGYLITG